MERMDHGGPQGLAVSADGYTLVPSSTELTPGTTSAFAFKVIGKDGKPVKSYTVLHDKELHLIVVRRDLAGYQHVHPTRAASGTWSVPLAVASAGVYKAFANFQPSGQAMPMPMTLAVLHVHPEGTPGHEHHRPLARGWRRADPHVAGLEIEEQPVVARGGHRRNEGELPAGRGRQRRHWDS